MTTVVDTHSIVGTVNQTCLSASTHEVVQENVSSSLSKEGIASNTLDCVCGGGGQLVADNNTLYSLMHLSCMCMHVYELFLYLFPVQVACTQQVHPGNSRNHHRRCPMLYHCTPLHDPHVCWSHRPISCLHQSRHLHQQNSTINERSLQQCSH